MSILRTEGIIKDYPGTRALDDVTVSLTAEKSMPLSERTGRENQPWLKYLQAPFSPQADIFIWMMRNCISVHRWKH